MYILLRIKCAKKYSPITFESAHEFSYEGLYKTQLEAERHIEETELTMDFISNMVGPGIKVYTVGDNPDYYILLETFALQEYPVHIGRLTVK
jgi:hypothetical protein